MSLPVATSALWCVKHRGRAIALVTGVDRSAAAVNAAPLIKNMDEDDLRIAAVGEVRAEAGPVVMDLRPPRPKPSSRTVASRNAETAKRRAAKAAKEAPFTEAASAAWLAACAAVACHAHRGVDTFAPTDRSQLAAACRFGFWRAAYSSALPVGAFAKATGSHPRNILARLADPIIRPSMQTALAETAATKVFAAHLARTC